MNPDRGCKTSRHRPDHHNEYQYAQHENFWKTCMQYNRRTVSSQHLYIFINTMVILPPSHHPFVQEWLTLDLTYPGVGGYIVDTDINLGMTEGDHNWSNRLYIYAWFGQAYFKVFEYEDVAKVRNGEEKVTSVWKIKEGTLEERLLGVAEDAWRLVVSFSCYFR